MTFYGYRRPDGRVGVRNKVLILPTSVCASDTARIISQQVEGSVTFNNQQGCSQVAVDQQLTMDVMAGYAANPNIYGTVLVSLGCENCQMDLVAQAISERTCKPMQRVIIQEAGGTLKAVEQAVRYAKQMVAEASLLQREEFPISELIVGTECGGSDPTSGLAANPAIGAMSDLVVAAGGTSILSETSEFIGAEHILARRAANKRVHDRIYEITTRFEEHFHAVGEDVRQGNPSPGNNAGGITTLEEKSLGCIHAASPPSKKNRSAASTRAATALSTRSMTTASRSRRARVWSSWTPRAMIRPRSRPWRQAARRSSYSRAAVAHRSAARSCRSSRSLATRLPSPIWKTTSTSTPRRSSTASAR